MRATTIPTPFQPCRRRLADFRRDHRGIAATEFAVVFPLMLVLFFGVVEFSTGVAIARKVTIVARTLSDLVSQNTSVDDTKFTGFFTAGTLVMSQYAQAPYSASAMAATISEIYIDPNTHTAKVQWSKGSQPLTPGLPPTVPVPTALMVDGTYLIYSEVSYAFSPTFTFDLKSNITINLKDRAYTRPRQSTCVLYGTTLCPTN